MNNRHVISSKKNLKYCFARLSNKNPNKLVFAKETFDYQPIWFSKYSVLSNLLEEIFNQYEYNNLQPLRVDKLIVHRIVDLCKKHRISLIFAFVTDDEHTDSMKNYFLKRQINFVDLHVDYMDPKYNIMPHDNHPNALAHKLYKQKLVNYLTRSKFALKKM